MMGGSGGTVGDYCHRPGGLTVEHSCCQTSGFPPFLVFFKPEILKKKFSVEEETLL